MSRHTPVMPLNNFFNINKLVGSQWKQAFQCVSPGTGSGGSSQFSYNSKLPSPQITRDTHVLIICHLMTTHGSDVVNMKADLDVIAPVCCLTIIRDRIFFGVKSKIFSKMRTGCCKLRPNNPKKYGKSESNHQC